MDQIIVFQFARAECPAAVEELTTQYESLVNDKSVKELNFNVARFEPPNFGPFFLSLLQSYSFMNQASSAPLPLTETPPPPIFRPPPAASPVRLPPSPSINSRGATLSPEGRGAPFSPVPPPGYSTRPAKLPGNPLLDHSLSDPPPGLGSLGSRAPGQPMIRPQPPISRPPPQSIP